MIWVPEGTDLSLKARKGAIYRGPVVIGLYDWIGLYRAERVSPRYERRWFWTKRAMLRWFTDQ